MTSFKQSSAGNIFFLHFSRFFFFWCLLLIRVANNIRASALPVVFSFFCHIHWWIRNFLLRACRGGLKIREELSHFFLTYNPDFVRAATNAHAAAAKKNSIISCGATLASRSPRSTLSLAKLASTATRTWLVLRQSGPLCRSSPTRLSLQRLPCSISARRRPIRCKWTAHEQSATWCAPTTTTKKSYLFFVFF